MNIPKPLQGSESKQVRKGCFMRGNGLIITVKGGGLDESSQDF